MRATSPDPTGRAPWPQEWGPEGTPGRVWRLMAFCALFEVLAVAATLSAIVGHDTALALPLGLGTLAFGAYTWVGWMTQVRVRARGSAGISWDEDRGALVVDDQRLVTTVYLVAACLLALVMFLAAVVAAASAVDDGGAEGVLVVVLCVVVLAGLLWGAATMRRRGTPRLQISPDGLRRTAGGKEVELAWREVHGIVLTNFTKDYSITVAGPVSAKDITISGQGLAADPALVAQVLEFYLSHEEARPELGTKESLRRVQSGSLAG